MSEDCITCSAHALDWDSDLEHAIEIWKDEDFCEAKFLLLDMVIASLYEFRDRDPAEISTLEMMELIDKFWKRQEDINNACDE